MTRDQPPPPPLTAPLSLWSYKSEIDEIFSGRPEPLVVCPNLTKINQSLEAADCC